MKCLRLEKGRASIHCWDRQGFTGRQGLVLGLQCREKRPGHGNNGLSVILIAYQLRMSVLVCVRGPHSLFISAQLPGTSALLPRYRLCTSGLEIQQAENIHFIQCLSNRPSTRRGILSRNLTPSLQG